MEWFIHNHDSIIKQWTLKALTVEPKASHTQHAPPGPQRSQRHWTFLTPRDAWLLKVLLFFNFSSTVSFFSSSSSFFFFNPLNIFWYKNKPTYDESTMFVNCFSPFSCSCPARSSTSSPGRIGWRTNAILGPPVPQKKKILSLPVYALLYGHLKQKQK